MTCPKISICVPVYNTETYLNECLQSILGQTFADFELLCVDDGSTDSSGQILDGYAAKDPRIHVWHTENNGQAQARNFMLQQATGKYLYFVDSDDFLATDALQQMYDTAIKDNLDLLYVGITPFSDERHFAQKVAKMVSYYQINGKYKNIYTGSDFLQTLSNNKDYRSSTVAYFICHDLIRQNAIQFNDYSKYEDNIFVYSLILHAKRITVLDRDVYHRRYRVGSIMTQETSYKDIVTLLKCYSGMLAIIRGKPDKQQRCSALYYPIVHLKQFAVSLYQRLPAEEQNKVCKDTELDPVIFHADFLPNIPQMKIVTPNLFQKAWAFCTGKNKELTV